MNKRVRTNGKADACLCGGVSTNLSCTIATNLSLAIRPATDLSTYAGLVKSILLKWSRSNESKGVFVKNTDQ